VFEKTKINEKEAGVGPFLKKQKRVRALFTLGQNALINMDRGRHIDSE